MSVNCGSREATVAPLSADDESKLAAERQKAADEALIEGQRNAILAGARPGAVIIQKLKDGTALTAAELQAVVRWLALRQVREILD